MTPEEWPIAADAADPNPTARAAGGDRLSTVLADFFLDPAQRLTEQERALMTSMLHCLVGDIADELRARLPVGWGPANDESNSALVADLTAARLLDEPPLIALLLRRADEERIGAGARARSGRREARALQGLVSHENGAVSAGAMALILARGRRRDRFGQCLIAFDDLPAGPAEKLVTAIAAALRRQLGSGHGAGTTDDALGAAIGQLLARRDPARAVDVQSAALAQLLDENGSLDDDLVLAAANDGEIGFVAQAFARRAGIGGGPVLDELLSGDPRRVMAVLRASGASRELAAGMLAGIGDLLGIGDAGQAIDQFDRITDEEVGAVRARLATPSGYRSALLSLDRVHGQRTL